MDNLAIGVVTSVNLKERYNSCMNTWSKDFDNVFFFGGNIFDENLIQIKEAGEDYHSHFLKQQLGFKYMYESNTNFDWYCMTSCDAMLFKDKTMIELSKFNHKEDLLLGQPCGNWIDTPFLHEVGESTTDSFKALAGGGGFFVSNSLMKKCYDKIDEFNEFWTKTSGHNYPYSDVAFAYMVYKYFKIEVIHVPYILSQSPEHYEDAISGGEGAKWYINFPIPLKDALESPMSFHYIKPDKMESVYQKYKTI